MTRTEWRRFKKAQRSYKKRLVKLAKKDDPWDYSQMLLIIKAMLNRRYEYFKLGDNVQQDDEERTKVISQISEVLKYLNEAETIDDGWIKYSEFSDCDEGGQDRFVEQWKAQRTKIKDAYKKAFELFAENFQSWWD